jgi:hypothetical protein
MVPLFMEALCKDSRVMPRAHQQVDWSNGGDGIVVRDTVKSVADLRVKPLCWRKTAWHFFVADAWDQRRRSHPVSFKFTQDAFRLPPRSSADKRLQSRFGRRTFTTPAKERCW